jgi:hypothetical protein
LTSNDLLELRKTVETLHQRGPFGPPNGCVDLRGISESDISFHTLRGIISVVRDYRLPNEVRIAIIAPTTLQYGYARMFQMLLNLQQVEIAVFKEEDSALQWLAINTR